MLQCLLNDCFLRIKNLVERWYFGVILALWFYCRQVASAILVHVPNILVYLTLILFPTMRYIIVFYHFTVFLLFSSFSFGCYFIKSSIQMKETVPLTLLNDYFNYLNMHWSFIHILFSTTGWPCLLGW